MARYANLDTIAAPRKQSILLRKQSLAPAKAWFPSPKAELWVTKATLKTNKNAVLL